MTVPCLLTVSHLGAFWDKGCTQRTVWNRFAAPWVWSFLNPVPHWHWLCSLEWDDFISLPLHMRLMCNVITIRNHQKLASVVSQYTETTGQWCEAVIAYVYGWWWWQPAIQSSHYNCIKIHNQNYYFFFLKKSFFHTQQMKLNPCLEKSLHVLDGLNKTYFPEYHTYDTRFMYVWYMVLHNR